MEEPVTLRDLFHALRAADALFHAERDRRYSEVAVEREKALRIKERADETALELARQIQTYKDAAHNGLVEQMRNLSSVQASKVELHGSIAKLEEMIRPLTRYVDTQQGRGQGLSQWYGWIIVGLAVLIAVLQFWKA